MVISRSPGGSVSVDCQRGILEGAKHEGVRKAR